MIADVMLDTNVLVYAASRLLEDRKKTDVARDLLLRRSVGISAQVIQEFVVVTTRKVRSPWNLSDALDWVEPLEDYPCVNTDVGLIRFGVELARQHNISYWDGAILAAAHRLNARVLYTEDLNHGQKYGSVRVENPFIRI